MIISNRKGNSVSYQNDSIHIISFHKAGKVLSPDDCVGNGIAPESTVMSIAFKDGTIATFEALNWSITEI